MTEDVQVLKKKNRQPTAIGLAVVALVLLVIAVVPPLVSINGYKGRITHLMAQSLGRPVRLASVELRLLPLPAFILTDLTVEDDPAYGAEPVLHANTVIASIRLWSLWRGHMEIGTISVDEASLNLVRSAEGRWNLDPLFRSAAKAQPDGARGTRATPLPYLEATNSRINFKSGNEKLPFSLLETDLSFWQEQPGDWRIRLRGQPARTDLSLDLADTGLVRLEARAQRAPELRQMPVHLDLEWREAQLGQLGRLLIGSDPGWRGDLTGELHLDGTAEEAKIQTRLRATGVHRAEFAPAAPMDFDATCSFIYRLSRRSLENPTCDSPLGDGRIHLAGDMPPNGRAPHLSVELDRIPVAAGLDALRTVRSDFGPGLEASGTISGKISYAPPAPDAAEAQKQPERSGQRGARREKAHPPVPGRLTGSFTVAGFELSGDGLSTPIQASSLILAPVTSSSPSQPPEGGLSVLEAPASAMLEMRLTFLAGGPVPLAVTARLARAGYQISIHGPAGIARARELARIAGIANAPALDVLTGDPATVDLAAAGPWLPPESLPFTGTPPAAPHAAQIAMGARLALDPGGPTPADTLSGVITLHNANWKAPYLANTVKISQATLHLGQGVLRWDPILFTYGPVKGTAILDLPAKCEPAQPCLPTFEAQFGELNASALEAAFLGAHAPGTLLSSLLDKLRPSSQSRPPAWPPLQGTVKAQWFLLGPVVLGGASATVRIQNSGAQFTTIDGDLLGGHMHGSGSFKAPAAGQPQPAYTLEAHFEKLSTQALGRMLGQTWSGGPFQANGRLNLSGFTEEDLANSAKGTLHFDWRHGTIAAAPAGPMPPALTRFERWTAEAAIDNGAITLEQNQAQQGSRKQAFAGTLTFADPPRVTFAAPK
jgi:AsmA family/AsmA-like C-terminal region